MKQLIERLRTFVQAARMTGVGMKTVPMLEEAADAIEKQQAELAEAETLVDQQATELERRDKHIKRLRKERDAAVADLTDIMFVGGAHIDTCQFCKTDNCYNRGGQCLCCPEWRGVQENVEQKEKMEC